MGEVKIIRTYFRESEVFEGDYYGAPSTYTDDTEVYDDLTAREAVDRIRSEGLTFSATGNHWAASPDGSRELYSAPRISLDGNDWREETTAHLVGFPDRVVKAIMEVVG